jgi:hypothetical protein
MWRLKTLWQLFIFLVMVFLAIRSWLFIGTEREGGKGMITVCKPGKGRISLSNLHQAQNKPCTSIPKRIEDAGLFQSSMA